MIDLEQVLGKERRGNSVIVYNNDEIDFRPFAFVLNVKELVNKDSVAIAPGYILKGAQSRDRLHQGVPEGEWNALWHRDLGG
jgi:hypothetical protein